MKTTKSKAVKVEATPKKTRKVEKVKTNYLVKTKGYKETFSSLDQARNQLEILKKRSIRNQNSIKIQIFEKSKGNLELIDEVQISDGFFDEQ